MAGCEFSLFTVKTVFRGAAMQWMRLGGLGFRFTLQLVDVWWLQ